MGSKKEESIIRLVSPEDGGEILLYAVEQTRLGGWTYLLAADSADGDGEAYILRDVSEDGETDADYEFVEDEEELNALAGIFSQMLDNVDLS